MRIACVTDNLGSGGSQRQLVLLARMLKRRGHAVVVVTYNQGAHFEPELHVDSVPHISLAGWAKWARPFGLQLALSAFEPTAVVAFQAAPSFYAEVSKLFGRHWRLVASERTAAPDGESWLTGRVLRRFHRLADAVTTNSYANREQIERAMPELEGRVKVIPNAVDLNRFRPEERSERRERFDFVVLSSHKPAKNFDGLAQAVRLLLGRKGIPEFRVRWYGDEEPGWRKRNEMVARDLGVSAILSIEGKTTKPEKELGSADALVLPSLWEGMPNSVCEALACGRPALIGDVADGPRLVTEGVDGMLFDPTVPASIAEVMEHFMRLGEGNRSAMERSARQAAVSRFCPEAYAAAYEALLRME